METLLHIHVNHLPLIFAAAIVLSVNVVWLWALLDCWTKESAIGREKQIWGPIILFAHIVGALIYLVVRRPRRIEEQGG